MSEPSDFLSVVQTKINCGEKMNICELILIREKIAAQYLYGIIARAYERVYYFMGARLQLSRILALCSARGNART